MTEETNTSVPQTNRRPLGVWILTIYLALFAGVLPLGLSTLLLVSDSAPADLATPSSIALSILIGVGVTASSVAAWQGKNWGRYALVTFIVLHYGLVALNNFLLATGDVVSTQEAGRSWARVIRGPLTIYVVAWYFFFSEKGKRFYASPEQSHKVQLTSGSS